MEDAFERQEELESMSLHWGAERFKRRMKKAESEGDATRVGAARKLLLEAVSRTETILTEWVEAQASSRGRRHTAHKWVERVGPDLAAYLTCKVVLGNLGRDVVPVRVLATKIVGLMMDELRCERFQKLAPGLFKYRMAKFQTNSRAHMARSISATAAKAVCSECYQEEEERSSTNGRDRPSDCPHLDMSDLELGYKQRVLIGTLLIRMLMEAFPGWLLKGTKSISEGGKATREAVLIPTPEALEWLNARNEFLAELAPVSLPMVVPPRPWGPNEPGGYRFGLLGKHPFVRGSKSQQKAVDEDAPPLVFDAVNRIQETPWRVNLKVWDVIERITEGGGGLAGLPDMEPVPMPRKTWKEGTQPDGDELNAWKRKKTDAFEAERARMEEARKWINLKTVVETMKHEGAFWFPHNLDFRGRVYPLATHLQPQGDDRQRSILEFADGEPLGPMGIWWLSIHGANCLGVTPGGEKMTRWTLGYRSKWIQEHSKRIQHTAMEPFSDLWWTEADEPWQFLAFCFEWAGMLEHMWGDAPGGPEEYVCHLPVSVDGSCNGLQHFSGMLRDPEGAQAVNVTANQEPEDVYTLVADKLLDKVELEAVKGSELAEMWLASGLIGRKLAKRPTMTFVYGSKTYGFADQLWSHLKSDAPDGWEDFFLDQNGDDLSRKACNFLASAMWDTLTVVVKGAANAMEWMQSAAREIAKAGRHVRWTVPETKFPVHQDQLRYYERKRKRIDTHLAGGVSYRPSYYEAVEGKPDLTRQANAIAPNVVHSLDAAALMKTVLMASEDGVEHFHLVHDSYGTLPARMDALVRATRQAFFQLYSRHDVVEELYHEWLNQVDDLAAIETPPSLGDLDVSEVLASDYFFA